ncbi:MAG: hypothetical protein ACM3MG_04965 [Bacillota bacterium]
MKVLWSLSIFALNATDLMAFGCCANLSNTALRICVKAHRLTFLNKQKYVINSGWI